MIVDGQNIKRGLTHSCGCIKSSIGEQLVQDYLDARGYTYETQVSLQGLVGVGGYELSYDFGVSMPKVGRVLIEYQGEQHYKIRDYFGGEEAFLKQQEHDKRKREFAAEHGCPLIEIPYTVKTELGIKRYLDKAFKSILETPES